MTTPTIHPLAAALYTAAESLPVVSRRTIRRDGQGLILSVDEVPISRDTVIRDAISAISTAPMPSDELSHYQMLDSIAALYRALANETPGDARRLRRMADEVASRLPPDAS